MSKCNVAGLAMDLIRHINQRFRFKLMTCHHQFHTEVVILFFYTLVFDLWLLLLCSLQ